MNVKAKLTISFREKGLYNDNGTKYEVHPGDTTFTCDGAGHAIENIGDEDLVFMALILLDK